MKNSFFNRFTPKEPKFFPMLKEQAQILGKVSDLLTEMLQVSDHNKRMDYYHLIKEQEKEGDRVSRTIFEELGRTFITPFDREDIHQLAESIDDVTDGVNSCAKRIAIFNPAENLTDEVELARIIREDANTIDKAIDELETVKKNASTIKRYCDVLHSLENRADDIYEASIMKLFDEENSSRELIKNKEILYELERTTDMAEKVGKVLKTIIVKYA